MGKTKQGKASPAPVQPALYYSLHTLLETIRVIKVYEDPLCTLLHAIQTAGHASREVEQELQGLLEEMPSQAYLLELDGLRGALGKGLPEASPSGTSARSKTPGKPKLPARQAAKANASRKRK